jgi:hypothetical protein
MPRNQPTLSLRPKSEYCIIGRGVSRMRSLCQSPGRGNANRFFVIEYADTVEALQRCCPGLNLIGLPVERVV